MIKRRYWAIMFSLGLAFAVMAPISTSGYRSNSAGASAQAARPLKVVLIGDSYSAGNGARNSRGSRSYYGPEDCYRSNDGWAGQYVRWLRTQGHRVTFVNAACSGAVTDNLINERKMDTKRGVFFANPPTDSAADIEAQMKLKGTCKAKDPNSGEFYKAPKLARTGFTDWVYGCDRYMQAQIRAIGADTDLVLFSIGGNDIGFSDIVSQCFALGLRDVDGCRDKVETAATLSNDALPARLDNVFSKIRARMRPDAKVGYLSYPQLEKSDGYSLKKFGRFSEYKAGKSIRQLGRDGEAGQRAAVQRANSSPGPEVRFVDTIKDHFAGPPSHEPDGSPYNENEARWVAEFDGRIRFEWYHYNAAGHPQVAKLLEAYGAFGIGENSTPSVPPVDVAFAIDATGSMGDDIAAVKFEATRLIDLVADRSSSARFGLVTYKDHPSNGGDPTDYPSRLELSLTSDTRVALDAINALGADGGGDGPESVYSGLEEAIALPWRPGVRKVIIVLGDAPAKDPEPVTGFTADRVVADALAVDPAAVHVVEVGGTGSTGLGPIAEQTGGSIRTAEGAGGVADALAAALTEALDKPSAFLGGPYTVQTGDPVDFDASGSYDPDGSLVSYEWDFDGDGTYDRTTSGPDLSHMYPGLFSGFATLRVTDDDGNSALASVLVNVTRDGDEVDDEVDSCVDDPNPGQEDEDGDGIGDVCDPEPGLFPAGPETVYDGAPSTESDEYVLDGQPKLFIEAPGVLGNDRGSGLTAVMESPPRSGEVDLATDGSFVFTPLPGQVGEVTFRYKAVDGAGASTSELVNIKVKNAQVPPATNPTGPTMPTASTVAAAPPSQTVATTSPAPSSVAEGVTPSATNRPESVSGERGALRGGGASKPTPLARTGTNLAAWIGFGALLLLLGALSLVGRKRVGLRRRR